MEANARARGRGGLGVDFRLGKKMPLSSPQASPLFTTPRSQKNPKSVATFSTSTPTWRLKIRTVKSIASSLPRKQFDRLGMSPLHLAAWAGRVDQSRLLLRSGADPNALSTNNETALLLAAQYGKTDVVRFRDDEKFLTFIFYVCFFFHL